MADHPQPAWDRRSRLLGLLLRRIEWIRPDSLRLLCHGNVKMSTASRQFFVPDDARDTAPTIRPPLREVVRDQVAVGDHVVHGRVDWEPFDSPWRAPQALLELIAAATAGQRPQRPHR